MNKKLVQKLFFVICLSTKIIFGMDQGPKTVPFYMTNPNVEKNDQKENSLAIKIKELIQDNSSVYDIDKFLKFWEKFFEISIKSILNQSYFFDNDCINSMHFAVLNGRLDVVQLFHEYDEKLIFSKTQNGFSTLHSACKNDCGDIAEFLIHNGVDIMSVDKLGENVLHKAVCYNAFDVAEKSINKNNKSNNKNEFLEKKSNSEFTPLMLAIINNNDSFIKYLITHGANTRQKDPRNMSIISLAIESVRNNNMESLDALLQKDPELLNLSYCFGTKMIDFVPLMHAACIKNLKLFKYLVDKGANLYAQNSKGLFIINFLVKNNLLTFAQILYERDQNIINCSDSDALLTPLHYATYYKYEKTFLWLLSLPNIDVKILTNDQNNALHFAVEQDFFEGALELLKKDPSLKNQKNKDGKIPIDLVNKKSSLFKKFQILLKNKTGKKEAQTIFNPSAQFNQSAYDELMKSSNSKKRSKKNSVSKKSTIKKNNIDTKKNLPEKKEVKKDAQKKNISKKDKNVESLRPGGSQDVDHLSDQFGSMGINDNNTSPSNTTTVEILDNIDQRKNLGFKNVTHKSKKTASSKIKTIDGQRYEKLKNGDIKIFDSFRCLGKDCLDFEIQPSIIIVKAPAEILQKNILDEITEHAGSAQLKSKNLNDYYHSFSPLVECFGHYGVVRDHSDFINQNDRYYLSDCTEKYKICIKGSLECVHLQNGTQAKTSCPGVFEFIILKNRSGIAKCTHRYFLRDDLVQKKHW